MPTRKTSATRSKKSAAQAGRTPAGKRIAAAAREIAAYLRGEGSALSSYEIAVPDTVDVAAMRARLGLSQSAFARSFGLDVDAVQAWEQGRRRPDRAARILLAVIAQEPEVVLRTLMVEAAA
ncbi:MAG TPA: helix-turn-helix domain-containing protein [Stellaceae bacterium]|jgi:putative transcriptional regulator|nr:helix-turn-helix domain-containing protein [Stellaceae bacterium]